MNKTAARLILPTLVFCTVLNAGDAAAAVVVVPNALANAEGNDSGFGPFFGASVRYQQVYSASQFPSSGPLQITQIAFRPTDSPLDGVFTIRSDSVRIDLSTTSATPSTLNTVFANNVGADNATVFNSFESLTALVTPPVGLPKDFIVTFNVTPFIYDPSAGNLLLDVRVNEFKESTSMDAQANSPLTATVEALGSSSLSGEVVARGLVTQFLVTQVPEPSTLTLSSVGALIALGALCARRRRVGD